MPSLLATTPFTSKHSMKTHMAKRHNLRQDLLAQLEAANSLTPSSELTARGRVTSVMLSLSLLSDVPGNSSAGTGHGIGELWHLDY